MNMPRLGRLLLRLLPWLCCGVLACAAFVFKFVLPGYSFSALVCCGMIAVILFYTLVPRLGARLPRFTRFTVGIVTALLILGTAAAAITEAVIIKASFGNPGEEADYLVVLGAKVRADGPSVSLWDRIDGAYDYLAAHPNTIAVVSGGQGPDEHMTEAQSMFDELTAMGIDPDRVWMEDKATSTKENILFSLDLIEEKTGVRPEKLWVVSSEYHLCRAGMMTRDCGVEFAGVPASTSRFSQKVNHFLREIAGVWHYLVLGS